MKTTIFIFKNRIDLFSAFCLFRSSGKFCLLNQIDKIFESIKNLHRNYLNIKFLNFVVLILNNSSVNKK